MPNRGYMGWVMETDRAGELCEKDGRSISMSWGEVEPEESHNGVIIRSSMRARIRCQKLYGASGSLVNSFARARGNSFGS